MIKDRLPLQPGHPSLDIDTIYAPDKLTDAIIFIENYANTGPGVVIMIQERDGRHPQLAALRLLVRGGSQEHLSRLVQVVESSISTSSPTHVSNCTSFNSFPTLKYMLGARTISLSPANTAYPHPFPRG